MIAHEHIRATQSSRVDQRMGRESDHGASKSEICFSLGTRMVENTHTLSGFSKVVPFYAEGDDNLYASNTKDRN